MIAQTLFQYGIIPAFESVYKRRKTFRYFRELERTQWSSHDELMQNQLSSLKNLLQHAASHCAYYRSRWKEIGLGVRELSNMGDFSRWPVLTKEEIRLHRKKMRSARFDRLISKSTGGSTGKPLSFDLNHESHERRTAAMFRGYGWAGATPGTKQFFLWGVPLGQRNRISVWKENCYRSLLRQRVINSFELSEESAPQIHRNLRSYRPDVVVAYTGAIYEFARLLDAQGIQPYSPKSIIVGAEKLHDFQRELIESVFRAPVFETYGSREFMMIGAECERHEGLHLTTENLIIEVLNNDGTPTEDGNEGEVVITDLFNYGMPFIRYATGDRAIATTKMCSCRRGLPLLGEVRGRKLDIIQTKDGRRIPGEFFPHLMKDFDGIRKFQIVQSTQDLIEVRVVLAPEWTTTETERLTDSIATVVGPTVRIDWKAVPEIPLTQTGKHRVVVNQIPGEVLC